MTGLALLPITNATDHVGDDLEVLILARVCTMRPDVHDAFMKVS